MVDFGEKPKTRKNTAKTANYGHHTIEKTNESRVLRYFWPWYHRENELQKSNPEIADGFWADVSDIGRTSDQKCRIYGFKKIEIYTFSHSILLQSIQSHQIWKLQEQIPLNHIIRNHNIDGNISNWPTEKFFFGPFFDDHHTIVNLKFYKSDTKFSEQILWRRTIFWKLNIRLTKTLVPLEKTKNKNFYRLRWK